ncbi:MAG: hypothetical protein JXR60_12310 [Bacteroidales bacterium]|nr:hypothetical protein [Bacteroidales bacterium]
MKFFVFNILGFIANYLGTLFGKPKWQRWIYSLLNPLIQLKDNYNTWRRRRFYLINITSQVIRLEGFLNDEFDNIQRRIWIEHFPGSFAGAFIALEDEVIPYLETPLESEVNPIVEAPFIGSEADTDFLISFVVHIPISLNAYESRIIAAVENYKLAGKQFVIRYF